MAITQFSTMSALMLGRFDAAVTVKRVLSCGTLGVGTFEGLDGEALIIDGKAYNGLPGGEVIPVGNDIGMAFATVADFTMFGTLFQVLDVTDVNELKNRADEVRRAECGSDNYPCVCRIDGTFLSVTVRSCKKQPKPYRTLFEVAKDQVEATKENLDGTIIGIYFPKGFGGVNLPGWHFHFISRDRKSFGGHVLACALKIGNIGCKKQLDYRLVLPDDQAYRSLDLAKDISKETASVEGESQKKGSPAPVVPSSPAPQNQEPAVKPQSQPIEAKPAPKAVASESSKTVVERLFDLNVRPIQAAPKKPKLVTATQPKAEKSPKGKKKKAEKKPETKPAKAKAKKPVASSKASKAQTAKGKTKKPQAKPVVKAKKPVAKSKAKAKRKSK